MNNSIRHRTVGALVRAFGLTLAVAAFAAAALAVPQSSDQQRCLNNLTKAGADVVRQQGKSNWKCLRNATRGSVDNLGDPGDTLSAQACLTNDVGDKVAQKQQRTVDRDLFAARAESGAPSTPTGHALRLLRQALCRTPANLSAKRRDRNARPPARGGCRGAGRAPSRGPCPG